MFGEALQCGTVQGRRICLVPHEQEYLETYVQWFQDPLVTRYLTTQPMTSEQEQEWFEKTRTNESDIVWAIAVDGVHIGGTGLHRIDRRLMTATSGMVIGDRSLWGKGIGTLVGQTRNNYAFSQLGLLAIYTEICCANEGMLKVAQKKLGYRQYGQKPFGHLLDGEYCDTWLGVLTPET